MKKAKIDNKIMGEMQIKKLILQSIEYDQLQITVAEKELRFNNDLNSKISYHSLSMMSICKDNDVYKEPCIYCILDIDDMDTDDDDTNNNEMIIVVNKTQDLDVLFKLISQASALNPDPNPEKDGNILANMFGFKSNTEDEEDRTTEEYREKVLKHLDSILTVNIKEDDVIEGQFDDA